MKKTLFIATLFFIIGISSKAQKAELPFNEDKKFCYQGVVEIPNKNREQLYKEAKEYVLLNYKNKDFPVLIEEENERIYVKGTFKVRFRKYYFPIFFKTKIYDEVYTMKIYFKDNKIRYEISDIFLQRKINAKATGYYWGYGISTTSIKESEIIKYDLEKFYIKRYRGQFYRLFQDSDKDIKNEIDKLSNYLKKDNNMNNW